MATLFHRCKVWLASLGVERWCHVCLCIILSQIFVRILGIPFSNVYLVKAIALLITLGIGYLGERLDEKVPGNHLDETDLLCNLIGAFYGVIII